MEKEIKLRIKNLGGSYWIVEDCSNGFTKSHATTNYESTAELIKVALEKRLNTPTPEQKEILIKK